MESLWQLSVNHWENNVSAVRLTVFTGAGSGEPLNSYSFLELVEAVRKTSLCELETVHEIIVFVMTYNIGKVSTTRTMDMCHFVIHCESQRK